MFDSSKEKIRNVSKIQFLCLSVMCEIDKQIRPISLDEFNNFIQSLAYKQECVSYRTVVFTREQQQLSAEGKTNEIHFCFNRLHR